MSALEKMDRKKLSIASLIVAAVFFFFLNILSSLEIKTSQVDLTENQLFTLSEGSKKIISSINEPITFRFYYSQKFGEISPAHGNYSKRVRELLEHFAVISGGKINLKVINPKTFSAEEDEAVNFGIQGVPLDQTGELGYFGLAASNSTDDRKAITFFNPQREQFLEYDLTRIIFDLAQPKKKKIGLITGLLLEADPLLRYQPWPIMDQIKQFFEVESLSSNIEKINDDIDVLLIVHPKIIEDSTLYAIDQFVMRGGRALIFVDPQNETARMSPQAPPGAGSSELKKLFDAWGIDFDENKFVGDRTVAIRVSAQVKGRDVIADYLSWGIYGSRNLDRDDVVTGELTAISVASAGTLDLTKDSKLKMKPLLKTSPISQRISADLVRGEIDPERILKQFKPENKVFNIAARFQGKVDSAFSDGPPPVKDKKKDDDKKRVKLAPHVKVSKGDINLIVFADSDLLTTRFWTQQQEFFGKKINTPVSNNADFLVNSLDNLSGSDALISLRSRGLSVRPFHKINDLKNLAEDRYRKTEQQLTTKLKELQGKLSGLKVDNKPGAKVVLTSNQRKAFDKFRREMISTRKQLRDVQLALRKDIESLDTQLKILNIWAMPVLIAIVAVVLALVRRRRYHQQPVQG